MRRSEKRTGRIFKGDIKRKKNQYRTWENGEGRKNSITYNLNNKDISEMPMKT